MASTYYAWSNFTTYDKGKKSGTVAPGDKVTAASLGVTDEDFAEFVAGGSVRERPYPKLPDGFQGSPREYRLAQLEKARADEDYDLEIAQLPDVSDGVEPVEGGAK